MAGIQTARSATRQNTTGTVTKGDPGFYAEEEAGDKAGESESRADADNHAGDGESHAVPDDEPRMRERSAPRAMRMPISWVRCWTE